VQAQQNRLKKQIETNLNAAEKVLGKLSDAERAKLAAEQAREAKKARDSRPSRSGNRMDLPVPINGRAGAAVQYALTQLGDAYVWGADGPNSFDCSGLTMKAWAQAGVSLSHSAAAQSGEGRPVSKSQLQPGDLVFYYSPISHVAMYIGNGQIVHASRPGKPVKTDPIDLMPYSGAVRPG
jgi:cell wall-associated NlpC family hydrolase